MRPHRTLALPTAAPLVFLFLALVLATPPAQAQYMYLDSNGDGVHTAADALGATGTTTVDLWFDTGHNRDGSTAGCNSLVNTGEPYRMFSYEVCLGAFDGRVSFGSFTNHIESFPLAFFAGGNATEFYAWQAGSFGIDPGLYRLATVVVTVTSGAPSLQIIQNASSLNQEAPSPPQTAFSSYCPGLLFDNIARLGAEWSDIDGLPSGPTTPDGPPVLAAIDDMAVDVGALGTQSLHATDPDADDITFSVESGPGFIDATTGEPGQGTGTLHVGPHADDIGLRAAVIAASDGVLAGHASLQVRVNAGPNHPPIAPLPDRVAVVAGSRWRRTVLARDFDGQTLTIRKISGPDFFAAGVDGQGEGGAVGFVRANPSLCDAGDYDAVVEVGDGNATVSRAIHVSVRPVGPAPPADLVTLATRRIPAYLDAGDLNGDGLSDIVVSNHLDQTMSVFLNQGGGVFAPQELYPVSVRPAELSGIVLADFNEDGRLDAAVAARNVNTITIFLGAGNGTFTKGEVLPAHLSPADLLSADMNDDGHADLVAGNAGSNTVSVFLGTGNATFAPRIDTRVSGAPFCVTVGDWNRDGRLDLAVTGHPVSILLGHGDGTFRDPTFVEAGHTPAGIGTGDWDRDGALDLAVTDLIGALHIFRGDGQGRFTQTDETGGPYTYAGSIDVGDLTGDGIDDIVVNDLFLAKAEVYAGDGAGGFALETTIVLPNGSYDSVIEDLDGDAVPDLAMSDNFYGAVMVRRFAPGSAATGFARMFVPGGHRPVALGSRAPAVCFRLEPVEGSFTLEDVDPASLRLTSEGTGDVASIPAVSGKSMTLGDTNHNGIDDLGVCFSGESLGQLFSSIKGRQEVVAHLEGSLLSGRFFCTSIVLDLQGSGKPLEAMVSPNPLNPRGTLRFETSRRGPLTVTLFDLQGRVVRTLARMPDAPAGEQRIDIDGRTDTGTSLASGIYFFKIEAAEGSTQGRFSILK